MSNVTDGGEILCINTAGKGDLHGLRMRRLAEYLNCPVTLIDLDKSARGQSSKELWELICSRRWRLIYQEGTGIAGGWPLIRAARERRQPFIFSSGDPISGYFKATRGAGMGHLFGIYERELFRRCTGFVGWTPYLAGRAIELGARRAVTIEGAVDTSLFKVLPSADRLALRTKYGIPADHIVCGVVGSLNWRATTGYGYGLELVEAAKRLSRPDVSFLLVGDGTGRAELERRIPADKKNRVVFTGRIPPEEVALAMNAMDIGFITQSMDGLGTYRLTTKLPEYLACGLAIAMSPIPGFYDYVGEAGWPLPPLNLASPVFHDKIAAWLETLTREEVAKKATLARPIAEARFDYNLIGPRFARFVNDILSL